MTRTITLCLLLLLCGCKGRFDKPWLTPTQKAADDKKGFFDRHVWYNGSDEAELDALYADT